MDEKLRGELYVDQLQVEIAGQLSRLHAGDHACQLVDNAVEREAAVAWGEDDVVEYPRHETEKRDTDRDDTAAARSITPRKVSR